MTAELLDRILEAARVGETTPDVSGGTPDVDSARRRIAAPVASRERVRPEGMQKAIEQLCKGRFLTTEQLANLLHRNPERLRAGFLTKMTRSGTLRLKYPESANRPDQAYTLAHE